MSKPLKWDILGLCITFFHWGIHKNAWKYLKIFLHEFTSFVKFVFLSFCVFGVLCHNFWTNWDKVILSISKWPFELQFCKRYLCCWQEMALNSRKMAIYQLKKFSNWWIHKKLCLSVFMNISMKNWVTETYPISF